MRGAWIALVMMISCGAWAGSNPPTPAPSKQSDPHQQQATQEQQPSADGQRGTENAPFVTKPMDGNKTARASSKTESESSRETLILGMIPDYATAVFTGLLVAIGGVTAFVLGWQSSLLRQQIGLARAEFNLTHRPWLAITNFKVTNLTISKGAHSPANDHALWIDGIYTLTNSGSSPALYVRNWQVAENRPITTVDADNVMSALRVNTAPKQGMAVPPAGAVDEEFTARIEFSAPPTGTRNSIILCIVLGTTYQGPTSEEDFETIESFFVFQRQTPGMATPAGLDLISDRVMPDLIYRRSGGGVSRMT